jgi:hypothetical protein
VPKFEAHITIPRDSAIVVEAIAKKTGWTFSAIDGDPVMGKQAYCYLTHYMTDGRELLTATRTVSGMLRMGGVEVLREKVERIIYDSKTGVDELTAQP